MRKGVQQLGGEDRFLLSGAVAREFEVSQQTLIQWERGWEDQSRKNS